MPQNGITRYVQKYKEVVYLVYIPHTIDGFLTE